MKQWQAAEATLIKVRGKDNDTLANYKYVVNGQSYENNRVYVAEFKDNIGSYHKNKYNELRQLKQSRKPVVIWFNPNNPTESVIDRNMRWGLFVLMVVFCSAFIVIGLTVAYAIMTSKREDEKNKPSLSDLRKEWNEKRNDPDYEQNFIDYANERRHEPELGATTPTNAWLENKE